MLLSIALILLSGLILGAGMKKIRMPAIIGVPLAAGLACGNTVLAFAVLAILFTTPVGALLMDATYRKWLTKDKP